MKTRVSINAWLLAVKPVINPPAILGISLMITGMTTFLFFCFALKAILPAALCMSASIVGLSTLLLATVTIPSAKERLMFNRKLVSFVVSLSIAFSGLNMLLAATKETVISIYFIADAIAFLVLALARYDFKPEAKSRLNAAAAVILVVFFAIVIYKIKVMMG